jgi:tetratricopeptide (TPR) repeat protein
MVWLRFQKTRRPRLGLIALLLVGGALLGTGVHALHGYQVRRNSAVFLTHADRAEKEGNVTEAIDFLRRYVTLNPDDLPAVARLELLRASQADSPREMLQATFRLAAVLRKDPSRVEVRRKLAELQLRIGRYSDALEQLEGLLQQSPGDPSLLRMVAEAYQGKGEYRQAVEAYHRLLQAAPQDFDAYQALAYLLALPLGQRPEAEGILDELQKKQPNHPRTYVIRAQFWMAVGENQRARPELDKALQLGPEDAEALELAAQWAVSENRLEEAEQLLQTALRTHPERPAIYTLYARVYLARQDLPQATRVLREGTERTKRDPTVALLLAELLAQDGKAEEARQILTGLRAQEANAAYVALVEGLLAYERQEILQAVNYFEEAAAQFGRTRELRVRALYYAANCYVQMGLPDLAATVLRDAIQEEPQAAALRWLAAEVLASLRRVDEAIEAAEAAARLQEPTATQWALWLRLQALHQLLRPAASRDWSGCQQLAQLALSRYGDSPELLVTVATVRRLQGQTLEALQLLEDGKSRLPKEPTLYAALADHYEAMGLAEKAQEILAEADRHCGDAPALRVARLKRLKRGSEARQQLQELGRNLERFPEPQRIDLLKTLGIAAAQLGELELARQYLEEAGRSADYDLDTRILLYDLAFHEKQTKRLAELVAQMRRIENRGRVYGAEGAIWKYAEASRILLEAGDKPTPEQVQQARGLLEEARATRPSWARVYGRLAVVYEWQQQPALAADAYATAVRLGDRSPATVAGAVRTLLASGREAEADRLLRQLKAEEALPPEIHLTASAVLARSRDLQAALELAREYVERHGNDANGLIWYARLLEATDNVPEAEKLLRQATTVAPKEPRTWMALVAFYRRHEKEQEAREVVEKQVRSHLAGEQLAACLSACYELLGDYDAAENLWKQLSQTLASRPEFLAAQADFYVRWGKPDEAERLQREALRLAEQQKASPELVASYRRRLAATLASRRDYQRWQAASQLVEQNLQAKSDSPEDLRIKAILLASRNSSRLQQQAIAIFEQLSKEAGLSAAERFILAQLYYRYGKPQRGRDEILRALAEAPENAHFVAEYVELLLNKGELADAELWIQRLEELQPDRLRTVRLKATLLAAQGKVEEARATLKRLESKYFSGPEPDVVSLALLGQAYQRLQMQDDAGRLYREVAERVPEGLLLWADWLASTGQYEQAVEIAEQCWQKLPPQRAVVATLRVVKNPQRRPDYFSRFQKHILSALEKNPRSTELRLALAMLHDIEGDYSKAAALYSEVLQIDPHHVVALNNLAWLLSECFQKPEEAAKLIDLAIQRLGPAPELLDTKGVILYRLGKLRGPDSALELLEEAYATASVPHIAFHLARLYRDLGQEDQARRLLEQLGPPEQILADLHRSEQQDFLKLLAALNIQTPKPKRGNDVSLNP